MQELINFMMTPNEMVCNFLLIPLMLIDSIVNMLLFTTILNLKTNRKQKTFYCILMFLIGAIIKLALPNKIDSFICLAFAFILIYFIFKLSMSKSIICVSIIALCVGISEAIIVAIFSSFIHLDMNIASTIPFYNLVILLSMYLLLFIIYLIIKFIKFNIPIIENMPKKTKKLLIVNSIIGILAITPNLIFINESMKFLPLAFILYTVLAMITFFIISIFTTFETSELATTKQNLENAELYNKTLSLMYDNIRTFKHDFNNMVQVMGRIYFYG